MNVLIIGGGGREHALAWKAAQSPQIDAVYVAPGNAGTGIEPKICNIAIDVNDIAGLIQFVNDNKVGLTIVGPEAPLVLGIVDAFKEAGLSCFGPSKAAAQLEGSKTFCKDFLVRHRIPTADYKSFTNLEQAVAHIRQSPLPLVVKADGLAAGKGVIVAQTEAQAVSAVTDILGGNSFGRAGERIVIEEFLEGEEASFIVMVDGEHILPMASSQDHKARDNGDTGPNTGGMGAYSPAPAITQEIYKRIMRDIIEPTVRGMATDGHPYSGFLYAGLMIDKEAIPRVLEFNCRFGDPETQPIMMRLRSDLVALCQAGVEGRLDQAKADWDPRAALGVVLAAGGYPESYHKGDVIQGLPEQEANNTKVFHAGTITRDHEIVTNGGRVLCACALGDSVSSAQQRAYGLARKIHWNGVYFRTDIGYRAVEREQASKP